MIQTPPRTILEVFESLPEGTLCELINNKIIMPPAPSYEHQNVSKIIFRQLDAFIESNNLGEVQYAPLDVYLGEENVFQPDILFISKERTHIIRQGKIKGAPDLVIEILSPGSDKYDRQEKKEVYERFGVREYWLIDPKTREVQGFYLESAQFLKIAAAPGVLPSRLLGATFTF